MSDHPPTQPPGPPSGPGVPWGTAPGVPGAAQPAVPGQAPPPQTPEPPQLQPPGSLPGMSGDQPSQHDQPAHPPPGPQPGQPAPAPHHPDPAAGPDRGRARDPVDAGLPAAQLPTTAPDVPLHPTLPGGPGAARGEGSAPASRIDVHQLPHAASAGPQDGARGAMWFAALIAVVVAVCLVAAVVVALRSL